MLRQGPQGPEAIVATQRDRLSGASTLRLPKGRVEPGERLDEAARREVREEVGVEARVLRPLLELHYEYVDAPRGARVEKIVHFFLMEHVGGDPHPADDEMREVSWCALDEAATRLSFETERGVVRRALEEMARGPGSRGRGPL